MFQIKVLELYATNKSSFKIIVAEKILKTEILKQ